MKEKLLFKTIVGSQAYGTNVQGSDIDYKGIYIQDPMDILTFNYKPQIEVGKDECYYEVRRFIELLQTANPTVLEMLYMPDDCVIASSPQFDLIKQERSIFLTKKCLNSFGGYAVQQIQKARGLNKKMNWEKNAVTRRTPLDFCYVFNEGESMLLVDYLQDVGYQLKYCGLAGVDHIRDGYALYYDVDSEYNGYDHSNIYKGVASEDSNQLRLDSIPKGELPIAFIHYNKDGYTQHCNAYKSYNTWLAERNTQRYVDIEGHGQKIDGKNMLHCRRLIDMAMEIAQEGTINVRRPNAQELIDIRKGKVDLEKLLDRAEEDILRMNEVYAKCSLPDSVSMDACNDLLKRVRTI